MVSQWKMQVSWTAPQIETVRLQGFALYCQSVLLQFVGLVGLSKGTVVFHLFDLPFWGHDLTCGLNFLMQIRFYFDFWSIFSLMDKMQNTVIKLSCRFLFWGTHHLRRFTTSLDVIQKQEMYVQLFSDIFHVNLTLDLCALLDGTFWLDRQSFAA